MAKHTSARLGLLALLVFAAAVHVTADDLTDALPSLEGLGKSLSGVPAYLGSPRGDQASRSDVTACYAGNSITCAYTAKCASSKCDCCGCACATLTCWYNSVKSAYSLAAKLVPQVKTPAQRRAVKPTFCKFARAGQYGKFNIGLIDLYNKIQCPNYAAIVRSIRGWQANYDKWCKAFSV